MTEKIKPFDYNVERENFLLEIPSNFNFAFDVVAKRGRENDKTAVIAIDRMGEVAVHHRYSDLDRVSNQFANALITLKVNKGDTALIVMPRIVEWYHVILGCAKVGVVAMPGTNLLTAKDLQYRINQADAKVA